MIASEILKKVGSRVVAAASVFLPRDLDRRASENFLANRRGEVESSGAGWMYICL